MPAKAALSLLLPILLCSATGAQAQTAFQLRRVGTDASTFTSVTSAPGDKSRSFALTRDGRVLVILANGTFQTTPYLDIHTIVSATGESGALGLAFDPDFATNGLFYITHMSSSTTGEPRYAVVRYHANSPSDTAADPASRTIVMTLIAPTANVANHNGGWIGFGPDGLLYISRGEGPVFGTTAQDPATIYGKILRIDVHGDDFPDDALKNYAIPPSNPFAGATAGADEVLFFGLRNPYRCSFDRETFDFWIADVGSATWEEINVVRAAAWPAASLNFGWPCYEAARRNSTSGLCANPTGLTAPNTAYPRTGTFSAACIIGGFVYRGCAIESLRGRFLFGPSCYSGRIASVDALHPENPPIEHTVTGATLNGVYGWGEDAYGEVYVCGTTGLFKLVPNTDQFADCNHNGAPDACEIADGRELDINHDGIPDSCSRLCPADIDASGALNTGDIFWFLTLWFSGSPQADFNHADGVTVQDIFDFLAAFFTPC